MARALTPAQRTMLAEIAATKYGVLYVRRYSPPARTANALLDRGLICCSEPDYSGMQQDGWSLTDEGSAHLAEIRRINAEGE